MLVVNLGCLVWNVVLDYITYSGDSGAAAKKDESPAKAGLDAVGIEDGESSGPSEADHPAVKPVLSPSAAGAARGPTAAPAAAAAPEPVSEVALVDASVDPTSSSAHPVTREVVTEVAVVRKLSTSPAEPSSLRPLADGVAPFSRTPSLERLDEALKQGVYARGKSIRLLKEGSPEKRRS